MIDDIINSLSMSQDKLLTLIKQNRQNVNLSTKQGPIQAYLARYAEFQKYLKEEGTKVFIKIVASSPKTDFAV